MKSMKLAILLCVAIVMLSACGQSNNANDSVSPSSSQKLTLEQAPAEVSTIYQSNCMSCHAIDLSGKMGEPTNLQLVHERLSYDDIVTKLVEGGKTMPSFKERLTEDEIHQLATWLSNQ